jgi:uncharacterized membrane protein
MQRILSVDLARGLVMIIMALDHVRDFWSPSAYAMQPVIDPTIPTDWYVTRWITHLCAPAFVFLAGTSARFWEVARDASKRDLSVFLFTRGLWLVFVEFVIINWSWQFAYNFTFGQVIWAIGMSMITLSVLVQLPRIAILAFGLVLVLGHNLFDQGGLIGPLVEWQGPSRSLPQWIWAFLHEGRFGCLFGELGQRGCTSGQPYFTAYPLVPWLGLMALGYWFADTFRRDDWQQVITRTGLAMLGLFVLLRVPNLYGDASHWAVQDSGMVDSVKSFFNASKYPPSLQFVLITLGPIFIAMPWLERLANTSNAALKRFAGWVAVFGVVPFFYYVLHVPIIHASARLFHGWDNGSWFINGPQAFPADYEPQLWLTYLAWVGIVVLLYPACRWYADLKRRNKHVKVLTYL